MPSKNYASTRVSSLGEIMPKNVARLTPLLSFALGLNKGQEAAPIVADNTMYVVTAYPNYIYALDLTKPGAPLKWKVSPKPVRASQGVAADGWLGDPEGHSRASEEGWESRRRGGGDSGRGRDEYDDRYSSRGSGRGRGHGGWFGDPEGHSQASERGWRNR